MLRFTHYERNSILNYKKMPFFRMILIIDANEAQQCLKLLVVFGRVPLLGNSTISINI